MVFVAGYISGVSGVALSMRGYELADSGPVELSGTGSVLDDGTVQLDVRWTWSLPARFSGHGDTIILVAHDQGWRLANASSPDAFFSLGTSQDAEFYIDVLRETGLVVAYAQARPGSNGSATFRLEHEGPFQQAEFTVIHLYSKVFPASEAPDKTSPRSMSSRILGLFSVPGPMTAFPTITHIAVSPR